MYPAELEPCALKCKAPRIVLRIRACDFAPLTQVNSRLPKSGHGMNCNNSHPVPSVAILDILSESVVQPHEVTRRGSPRKLSMMPAFRPNKRGHQYVSLQIPNIADTIAPHNPIPLCTHTMNPNRSAPRHDLYKSIPLRQICPTSSRHSCRHVVVGSVGSVAETGGGLCGEQASAPA